MATKKTATRKTAPRATSKTAAKTTKHSGIKRIVHEANPDAHVATGKYRFLLCFMMIAIAKFISSIPSAEIELLCSILPK